MPTRPEQESERPVRPDPLLPGPGLIVSRGLIYVALVMLAAFAVWMFVAEVDVTVAARGRLVVHGQPIRMTAPEAALVIEVPVEVGESVAQGDVLIRLDAFEHERSAERIEVEIEVLRAEVARYRAAAAALREELPALARERDATETIAKQLAAQLDDQMQLLEQGIVSPTVVDATRREAMEIEVRLAQIDSKLSRQEREAKEAEQLGAESEKRSEGLAIQVSQLREQIQRATIRAPCNATVASLSVRHPGSVITIEQPAVVLVPAGEPLMACVQVPNASMRRLKVGLPARLEFDAFPREDFGRVVGAVTAIEPSADEFGNYVAWISLEHEDGSAEPGLLVRLQQDLLTDAQIFVERRTVFDLLTRPLRRLRGTASVSD